MSVKTAHDTEQNVGVNGRSEKYLCGGGTRYLMGRRCKIAQRKNISAAGARGAECNIAVRSRSEKILMRRGTRY